MGNSQEYMEKTMISHKLKIIFPRIGKNASSSVIEYFRRFDKNIIDDGHNMLVYGGIKKSLRKLEEENPETKNYFKFAVVRNPYDRLVSAWFEYKKPNQFLGLKNKKALESFTDFIDFIQIKSHVHWDCQHDMLFDDKKCLVDYVAKFEEIEKHIKKICDLINIDYKEGFPTVNRSEREHYSKYYTKEVIEIVESKYKKDLLEFGYAF